MKLAFVLHRYFPFGGLQGDMFVIACEALQRGHQVTVFCSSWQGDLPKEIVLRLLPERGWSNAARMSSFSRQVSAALAEDKFDLVVGFNKLPGLDVYYAADSCFAYKAFSERGLWYRQTARARLYLKFEKAVFAKYSRTEILELSLSERDRYRHYYDTDAARFHTLPPGIPRERKAADDWPAIRTAKRRELGIDTGQKLLLAVGSGFRTKGLDRSILALRQLTDFDARLFVVGQDNRRPFVKLAEQHQLSDKVEFLGGRNDVASLLQAADILLHPAYRENTGNVLLEAMVAGLPVVTTDVCGYSDYVDQADMGTVISSPYNEVLYVAAIIEALGTDTKAWHQKGEEFAQRDDIYQRPQQAVDILEGQGSR